jgi:hypothetical protein
VHWRGGVHREHGTIRLLLLKVVYTHVTTFQPKDDKQGSWYVDVRGQKQMRAQLNSGISTTDRYNCKLTQSTGVSQTHIHV